MRMNSSEIKKIIWSINLVVICSLSLLSFFVYRQLTKPIGDLKTFVYVEPPVTERWGSLTNVVTRLEVETVFGWKLPPPPPPLPPLPRPPPPDDKKLIVSDSNINNMFSLETILGRLAFVKIKKDKQEKCFIAGDDILDADGEILGVVKEIRADSILIFINGKVETLYMESMVDKKGEAKVTPTTKTLPLTNIVPPIKVETKKHTKKEDGAITDAKQLTEENSTNSPMHNKIEEYPKYNLQKSSFEGIEFEFYDIKDDDGTLHRKFPEEMALKFQQKEIIKKITDSSNYELVFQANGVLIKSIKNAEIKKIFAAFGISDSDVLLSVNGQSLGNKTEDDLISLYQQIVDTAKFATIELLKGGVRQKYRISTDSNKRAEDK